MSKNRDAILRQWLTLRLIPREPRMISTREVWEKLCREGYEIDLRTVQRDLTNMSSSFAFTNAPGSGSSPSVWYWPQHAKTMEVPGLEPTAALALMLSKAHLEPLLPPATLSHLEPYFLRAEEVLKQQGPKGLSQWQQKVRVISRGPRLAVPKVRPDVQQAIYEAILGNRQVLARYQRRGAASATDKTLNPLGLVSKDGMLYLVATEWNYKDPTHYALHRFVSAECSENVALVPDGFDFNRYVGEQEAFGYPESSDPIALEVLVSQDIANHLSERPLSKDQKIALLSEDQCRVTATVSDTQELRWWLRGFGAQLEVLKPATLRKEFKADALDLAEQYSARAPRSPKSPAVESLP